MIKETLAALTFVMLTQFTFAQNSYTEMLEAAQNAGKDDLAAIRDEVSELNKAYKELNSFEKNNWAKPDVFKAPVLAYDYIKSLATIATASSMGNTSSLTLNYLNSMLATAPEIASCLKNEECEVKSLPYLVKYYGEDLPITDPYLTRDGKASFSMPQEGLSFSLPGFPQVGAAKNDKATKALLSGETLLGTEKFGRIDEINVGGGHPNISTQADAAKILIDYLLSPLPPKLQKNFDAASDEGKLFMYQFKTQLRSYTALKSLMHNNLMSIFSARVANSNGKSQLEVEKDMATRRIKDSDWHTKMEKATPLTVQREIAYLLSEINYQLYLTRRINERAMAAMTIVGSNSSTTAKPFTQDE